MAVGRRELEQGDVERNGTVEEQPGMSDRKTGMKSARPVVDRLAHGRPAKSETEQEAALVLGIANGAGPCVCR